MNESNNEIDAESRSEACPNCGSHGIRTEMIEHSFEYGEGADAKILRAIVPLRKCNACGFSFLDHDAEQAQHAAICEHLNVMPPSRIKGLRKLHRLSVAQFAKLTRLGIASLRRWERGQSIQNGGYDDFLYLLGWQENVKRLEV